MPAPSVSADMPSLQYMERRNDGERLICTENDANLQPFQSKKTGDSGFRPIIPVLVSRNSADENDGSISLSIFGVSLLTSQRA